MNNKLQQAREQFDQQPVRMRILLCFSVFVLLAFIIDWYWISPNFEKAKQIKSEIRQVDQTIIELINAQQQITADIAGQRNHPLKGQLKETRQDIAQLKQVLQQKTINLVKPEAMSSVLSEILNRSAKLELLSLTKQIPVPLFDDKNNPQKTQMYRHVVELMLQGKYQDTREFIQRLEEMPQKVNFESLDYQVEDYPDSKIKLVVSTLSFSTKWIGG